MTELQKLQLRSSEVRTKLNELAGVSELTDEQRSEIDTLTNEYADLERRTRAAIIAADEPATVPTGDATPEQRELDRLRETWDMGRMFEAVIQHRNIDGAERDLQQALGMDPNAVPLSVLAAAGKLETRAATSAPDNVQGNQQGIIPYVFPSSVTAFLGIPTPTVPVGQAVYPVLTTKATAHTPAESGDAADSQGTFEADVLSPARIQASLYYTREDAAKLRGMAEALTENLTASLADGLDKQILTNATKGLLGAGLTAPGNPAAASTYGDFRDAVVNVVDGRYSQTEADAVIVLGADTYKRAHKLYRIADTSDSESAIGALRRLSGGVRVNYHIPAKDGDNRQDAVIARNRQNMHAVAPIWDGVTLIPDQVTKSGTGEVKITAVMLYAFEVIRTDGFSRVRFDLS
ncbi:MAG: phage major capsid protein [Dehalococcoidia bacterium]|nr:phage major capsid protein [Dehalococcoidia bacterium]MYK26972.1 phage major capsid protein [Dehalococcoidia bacterium]